MELFKDLFNTDTLIVVGLLVLAIYWKSDTIAVAVTSGLLGYLKGVKEKTNENVP